MRRRFRFADQESSGSKFTKETRDAYLQMLQVKRSASSDKRTVLQRFGGALAVACIVHLLFVFVANQLLEEHKAHQTASIQFLGKIQKSPKPRRKKDEEKKIAERPKVEGQVVALAPTSKQKRPDKADFLSTFNQSVKRQTQSAYKSPHSKRITSKPSAKRSQARPLMPNKSTGQGKGTKKKVGKRKNIFTKHRKEKGLSAQKNPLPKGVGNERDAPSKSQRKKLRLIPTWQELSNEAGMPFSDHLENVEIDGETRLNAFQWRHATFFNRIKESVAREWNPGRQIRRFDPQGSLIGRQDRMTVVKVTIDRGGKVKRLQVEKASGVDYLDEEAIRAFRVSGPFVHPPKVLFANAREFSFEFGFVLSVESGFGMGFGF